MFCINDYGSPRANCSSDAFYFMQVQLASTPLKLTWNVIWKQNLMFCSFLLVPSNYIFSPEPEPCHFQFLSVISLFAFLFFSLPQNREVAPKSNLVWSQLSFSSRIFLPRFLQLQQPFPATKRTSRHTGRQIKMCGVEGLIQLTLRSETRPEFLGVWSQSGRCLFDCDKRKRERKGAHFQEKLSGIYSPVMAFHFLIFTRLSFWQWSGPFGVSYRKCSKVQTWLALTWLSLLLQLQTHCNAKIISGIAGGLEGNGELKANIWRSKYNGRRLKMLAIPSFNYC